MNWYLAKLVFHVCLPAKDSPGQFEEKLRLIHAKGQHQALQKASVMGADEECEFINTAGKKVKWEFIAVSELRLLPDFKDGIEIDSHLEEIPATEEYIALQRAKHKELFLNGVTKEVVA